MSILPRLAAWRRDVADLARAIRHRVAGRPDALDTLAYELAVQTLTADRRGREVATLYRQAAIRASTVTTVPAYCVRCGHACAHTTPHLLLLTGDGLVCADGDACAARIRADAAEVTDRG